MARTRPELTYTTSAGDVSSQSRADIVTKVMIGKMYHCADLRSHHYTGLNFLVQPTSKAQTKELNRYL